MKIEKIITAKQPVELDITGVTLLSVKEAEVLLEEQLDIGKSWWLRSPGLYSNYATYVDIDDSLDESGYDVYYELGVRPAFRIANLKSSNLQVGDKLMIAGVPATVISNTMALADDIVGCSSFREDWEAPHANGYAKSDVKKWLDDWWQELQEA